MGRNERPKAAPTSQVQPPRAGLPVGPDGCRVPRRIPVPRVANPDPTDVRLIMECPYRCGVTVQGHLSDVLGDVMAVHIWLWHQWQYGGRQRMPAVDCEFM